MSTRNPLRARRRAEITWMRSSPASRKRSTVNPAARSSRAVGYARRRHAPSGSQRGGRGARTSAPSAATSWRGRLWSTATIVAPGAATRATSAATAARRRASEASPRNDRTSHPTDASGNGSDADSATGRVAAAASVAARARSARDSTKSKNAPPACTIRTSGMPRSSATKSAGVSRGGRTNASTSRRQLNARSASCAATRYRPLRLRMSVMNSSRVS